MSIFIWWYFLFQLSATTNHTKFLINSNFLASQSNWKKKLTILRPWVCYKPRFGSHANSNSDCITTGCPEKQYYKIENYFLIVTTTWTLRLICHPSILVFLFYVSRMEHSCKYWRNPWDPKQELVDMLVNTDKIGLHETQNKTHRQPVYS